MAKVPKICETCGASFLAHACRIGRFCSRRCSSAAGIKRRQELQSGTQPIQCAFCGKTVRRYNSRMRDGGMFCNKTCYHKWDSQYKSQPAQRRIYANRMAVMGSKPSGLENRVAAWLIDHGIQFEQQVKVHYCLIDFRVGNTLIEVNGCYWHGCAEHFPMITQTQQRRITRDKTLASYCQKRNIPLIVIWEHDIKHGDFSALTPLLGMVPTLP